MLGMSVGDRWCGTDGAASGVEELENGWEGGERSRSRRDDGLSRTTSGGLVLCNVSLLLILRRGIALPFFLPPRFEREKSRRADAGPRRLRPRRASGGLPSARGGVRRSASISRAFFSPDWLSLHHKSPTAGAIDRRPRAVLRETTILKIAPRARPAARSIATLVNGVSPRLARAETNKPVARIRTECLLERNRFERFNEMEFFVYLDSTMNANCPIDSTMNANYYKLHRENILKSIEKPSFDIFMLLLKDQEIRAKILINFLCVLNAYSFGTSNCRTIKTLV